MSVRIEFDLGGIQPQEAKAVVALLHSKFGQLLHEPTAVVVPGGAALTGAAFEQKVADLAPTKAEAGDKRKPGRPRKETSAEVPTPAPSGAAEVPTPAPSGAAEGVAPPLEPPSLNAPTGAPVIRKHTVEEIRAALQAFSIKTDLKQGKELISSFGCARVTDMVEKPAEVQAAFMAKCAV